MIPAVPSRLLTAALLILFLLGTVPVRAQTPFENCAHRSETNASLILPSDLEIRTNGKKHETSIRVGVFTPSGQCTGSAHWNGHAATLTAWGTSGTKTSEHTDGSLLAPGDTMVVHLFNPATQTTYTDRNSQIQVSFRSQEPHLTTHGRYVPDGMYVVDWIHVDATFVSRSD